MGFNLHDSISEQYLFLTPAIEIRVLPEPWRHARVQAIRCTHHIGEKVPPV